MKRLIIVTATAGLLAAALAIQTHNHSAQPTIIAHQLVQRVFRAAR